MSLVAGLPLVWSPRSAVEVNTVVDVVVEHTGNESIGSHVAVGDEYQPVLVVPAPTTGAGGGGEPEVRPVAAGRSRPEREKAGRTTLAGGRRPGRIAGQRPAS